MLPTWATQCVTHFPDSVNQTNPFSKSHVMRIQICWRNLVLCSLCEFLGDQCIRDESKSEAQRSPMSSAILCAAAQVHGVMDRTFRCGMMKIMMKLTTMATLSCYFFEIVSLCHWKSHLLSKFVSIFQTRQNWQAVQRKPKPTAGANREWPKLL